MLDQNVAKARKVVEGYKEHNQNTKERFVQIAPKTWVAVREHTDENAAKFAEKLLKESQTEKKDNRLNKVQKSGPKSKIAPKPRGPRPPRAVNPEVKAAYLLRQKQMYDMHTAGKSHNQIAAAFQLSMATVRAQLTMYRKENGIEYVRDSFRQSILEMIQKGCNNLEITEKLGCGKSTINHHVNMLLTDYPDLKVNKIRRDGKKGLSKENLIMKELLEQGYSANEIKEITGKALNTVSHHLQIIGAKIGAKWLKQVKKAKKERIEQNFKNNYKP